MSHVLAYAARAQIRSHSSPFSLLSYRLFDITRIHNAHCLYTRNFPLFHVFSLLLFSSPSCFCFLQFPFFPSCVLSPPLYLSVELTFFCLLASHSSLRLVNLVSFFFFSLRLNAPPPSPIPLRWLPFPRPSFRPSCSLYTRRTSLLRARRLSSRFLFVGSNPSSPRPDPRTHRACASERIQSARARDHRNVRAGVGHVRAALFAVSGLLFSFPFNLLEPCDSSYRVEYRIKIGKARIYVTSTCRKTFTLGSKGFRIASNRGKNV